MDKNKVLIIVLAVLNLIVIGAIVVLYTGTDKTAPVIEFSANDTLYSPGMDETQLMMGVTAMDNKDADVTNRIVIEKITIDDATNTAVVYYAASDMTGNVAKASRVFNMNLDKDTQSVADEVVVEELTENIEAEGTEEPTTEDTATEEPTESPIESSSPTTTASATPTVTPTPSQRPTASPNRDNNKQDTTNNNNTQNTETPKETPKENTQPADNNQANTQPLSVAPYMELKSQVINVPVGGSISWVDTIKTMVDDNDNYNSLFGNLRTSGFDSNTPGDYVVNVYTTDSDGHKSNTCQVAVHVQ